MLGDALRQTFARIAVTVASLTLVAGAASAQTPTPRDLWIPLVAQDATVSQAEVEAVFIEVLGGPSGPTHIVGNAGIRAAITSTGFDLPLCVQGLGTCSSEFEAAAHGLGADRVITVTALPRQGEVLALTIADVALGQRASLEVSGASLRDAVFAAVRAVTNASAHVTLESEPSGADIMLDGVPLGQTPYEGTLSVGSYRLRLSHDGYYDYGTQLELRANDVHIETYTLERRYAEIVVESDTPGAQVIVDGADVHPVNEPFRVLPGERVIEIRAAGHDTMARTLELIAGDERSFRVTLAESAETIALRKREEILARPIVLQLGFAGLGSRTSWAGARVNLDGDETRITCAVNPSFPAAGCINRTRVGHLGGDLRLLYDWKFLQIEPFGFTYGRLNLRTSRTHYGVTVSNETLEGEHGREFVWSLPGAGFRFQVNEDWSAYARTGVSAAFQRFNAERSATGEDVTVKRTDWFLRVLGGARYHLNPTFFGYAEVQLAVPIAAEDTRTRIGMGFGLGVTFPDRTGVRARLDSGGERREAPAPDAPEEL